LHPIHIKDEEFNEVEFEKLARDKKVVAIGETGLDYYYDRSSAELQKEVFEKSLKLATVLSKPIILHSRDAGEDVLSVLMSQKPEPEGVMHCFQGDWQMAKVILDIGLYISFTGLITFTKNQSTLEVIEKAPLERILIETDCPFMSPAFVDLSAVASAKVETSAGKPEPYRGKRNEPAYVIEVAKKISEIKKIPLKEVEKQTTKNAIELFGLEIL
jgi:TatD DNase family protein